MGKVLTRWVCGGVDEFAPEKRAQSLSTLDVAHDLSISAAGITVPQPMRARLFQRHCPRCNLVHGASGDPIPSTFECLVEMMPPKPRQHHAV